MFKTNVLPKYQARYPCPKCKSEKISFPIVHPSTNFKYYIEYIIIIIITHFHYYNTEVSSLNTGFQIAAGLKQGLGVFFLVFFIQKDNTSYMTSAYYSRSSGMSAP